MTAVDRRVTDIIRTDVLVVGVGLPEWPRRPRRRARASMSRWSKVPAFAAMGRCLSAEREATASAG